MIKRLYLDLVRAKLKKAPAVVVVGPRQCGKTTLAKMLPRTVYFDLESDPDRLRLDLSWASLAAGRRCVVLDEAQAMPELFPRLRAAIDSDRSRQGRFLLLGSVAPSLMKHVSQSLAGRLAVCEMAPILSSELPPAEWMRLWRSGGYPDGGLKSASAFPAWQWDYLTLLAQRDFPVWGFPALPTVTARLFKMLAAVNGQPWNASQLGQSLGLSYHTVNGYLEFLEQAFLIRRLPPWFANLGKRLVKSPRVYWRDSGLLHALLGLARGEDLLDKPWVGASWEGWVIEQLISAFTAQGVAVAPFWFRTQDQKEADLVLEFEGHRWAVEIKLTSLPKPEDMQELRAAGALMKADRIILVSRTERNVWEEREASVNLAYLLDRVADVCRLAR
jgi:predicted AAA+ superfamily ATPase